MPTVLVINNNPDSQPGRYTQQLIGRVREAGLEVHEARTVDAVDAYATHLAACPDTSSSRVGLIISCGSPVVLTEPVDLRAHIAKTTAAMLHFPDAPVVGICYGMQLLALLYGGKLVEQRDAAHRGVWADLRRAEGVASRLLDGMASRFPQWASNFIFVDQLPGQFVATAIDSSDRFMAMEHVQDHVYGIQWHPEVINERVGRRLIDRVLSLVGQRRSPRCAWEQVTGGWMLSGAALARLPGPPGPVAGAVTGSHSKCAARAAAAYPEAVSWHEVDLELRKTVKELVAESGGGRAAADLGKLLAGTRKDLLTKLRAQGTPCVGADGEGGHGAALAAAAESLRKVAEEWMSSPAPAG